MRLCPTKRLVTAGRMSLLLPAGVKLVVGSHLLVYHWFVHVSMYARSGCTGCWCAPPAVSGLIHASPSVALFPGVVSVATPVCGSASHGTRDAMFLTAKLQLASAE